ncbi:UDP-3-O-(3-hydroxymyristoyl)glucosamine N-acyltransferase [bacterium]|nr:UDP-3-O-(3-hydroxymyristoyl)glucosamine N-acyltransferase [bacterium]
MNAESITTGDLAERLSCDIEGDQFLMLKGIATIEEAEPDQLTFLANPRYRKQLTSCRAGAIIISSDMEASPDIVKIISKEPYKDFRRALEIFYPVVDADIPAGINPGTQIHKTAIVGGNARIGAFVGISAGVTIGENCTIYNGAYIGQNVEIGSGCIIGFNAVIRSDIQLGNRVTIGDGTIVGFDGFGYTPDQGEYFKIPQVGTVVIEDDVEIGANCCIDRASIGVTRIGRGSKLDNLIQVAHGVKIGTNTVIAAQTGISGSTTIGSGVIMGGQVGVAGHIKVGDGMIVGAQSGVTKSVDIKGVISGYPARQHSVSLRRDASISQITKLMKRISELEAKVEGLLMELEE